MEQSKIDNVQKLIKLLDDNDIDLKQDILDKYTLHECWSCGLNLVYPTRKTNEEGKTHIIHDDSQYCRDCKFYKFEPNMTEQEKINKSMHYRMTKYFKNEEKKENHTLDRFHWEQTEIHLECKKCDDFSFIVTFEDHNGDYFEMKCVFCGSPIPKIDTYNRTYESLLERDSKEYDCTCSTDKDSDCYLHGSINQSFD
jgi:hypothetical protein